LKKVMLLAAMLAMVLAAVAPAFGQGDVGDVNEGDDQFNVGDETVYSAVCQNIIGSFQAGAGAGGGGGGGTAIPTVTASPTASVTVASTPGPTADPGGAGVTQGALGFSFAIGGDNAAAAAEIAQEQNVSVEQVNECLNAFHASVSATTAAHVQYGGGGGGGGGSASATSSATALPATGGPVPASALALGAGALLVGGGLLARRIVR
jgi:hypothetical protein